MTPDAVAAVYLDGVRAVERIAGGLADPQWDLPACGAWTATETARHLAAVAGWYHEWLDRALVGELSRPFPAESIDAYTAASLDVHRDLDGPGAVAAFATSATAYLDRARQHWDLPFSFPFGTVTVGLHAGVAATEWHLHAWDLSQLTGRRHEPTDADRLLVAAAQCVAAADGGVKAALVRRFAPLAARRAPWLTLLRRSGRA
ncbi:MAG: maleylpyruvate isomerase N-terminal domain-containing protein [Ilumatobacter sp.]|uniref:maleylpyruvate isomerase N-terminal domain-containing protein n=1 Tax=Ilumatobacter sp. TaxID=1967498 RepID=UPI00260E508C|nr:maleylpyruvate isomerase N-terminal domain-containing protein [Ilumatobacter sp.]MDJ0769016.1 maleylpyruvate isomerase N-terminal domain-containing protein [Ilumatobacter sp.]